MDSNIQSIIIGVVANGLTSLIAKSALNAGQLFIGEEFLEKWKLEKTSLEPILHEAINSVAESIEWKGPAREEIVCLFLLPPQVEEIVRQIYSTSYKSKEPSNLPAIRQIFLTSFTQFVTSYAAESVLREDQLDKPADRLLDVLLKECDRLLKYATDQGTLAAHEAQSAFRHNVISSELEAIQKQLAFLLTEKRIDIKAILEYEKKYRSQVGMRHGYITPPNFDSADKKPIDKLFVSPRFYTSPKKDESPTVLKMTEFLSKSYRAVLLGNPGGGKSTLGLKLCHDLAFNYSERLFAGRKELTPILVVLREYGADKKAFQCSILEFIETQAKSTYQLTAPPPYTFEYLLLNGMALVIFDGLDELLDTSYRQQIRDDVESFCNFYPSTPILVTSREVGYEQAPLEKRMFEVFRLAEFDEEQIQEYVRKWFDVEDAEVPFIKRQAKIKAFLDESRIVPDLRSNPLMLALLCNIYKGENYIPSNRPEVYYKCSIMLFERWDKSRNLYTPPLTEEHMRPLMEFLAHWIYEDQQLRKGVTEKELAYKATEYLHEWLFEDIHKAERVANEFIHFCTGGRAWVFLDTGTKKEGEKLYQFAHQTFLEYFAAYYLFRTSWTPDDLLKILIPRIAKREWDVVAQLAFQIQNKEKSGTGDKLLTDLINSSFRENKHEAENLLSFAVRCLQFIVPRPKATRNITEVAIREVLNWLQNSRVSKIGEEVFGFLLSTLSDNREVVADSLEKELSELINNGTEDKALLGLGIITHFHPFFRLGDTNPVKELRDFWRDVFNRIYNSCEEKLAILYPKYFYACYEAVLRGKVNVADLINWHGIQSLFISPPLTFPHTIRLSPIIEQFALLALRPGLVSREVNWPLSYLSNIGTILLNSPVPWITAEKHQRLFVRNFVGVIENAYDEGKDTPVKLSSDAWFAIFAMIATYLERHSSRIETITHETASSILLIKWLVRARFHKVVSDKVQVVMDECGFSLSQQDFIWRWIRREIDLVEVTQFEDSEMQMKLFHDMDVSM